MSDANRKQGPSGIMRWRWVIAIWVVVLVIQIVANSFGERNEIAYTDFKQQLAKDNVTDVKVGETSIVGTFKSAVDGETTFTTVRIDDPDLLAALTDKGVSSKGLPPSDSFWSGTLAWLLPLALVVLLFSWMSRRAGGGGFGLSTVGRSKAKLYAENDVGVSFADVAGVEEAMDELKEVVEFLKTPERFSRLGGKLPKGILLVGPPGTGKTLLARAVAGEAGVPFFSISGSEFVEMFVGVGAARVRDLFEQASKRAPCIVFIDELDALGKARGLGPNSHEEREQTLNQLLVELDGFDPHLGIVLMAATNRPEILDPALLRAGRFDRHVLVDRPDKSGRLAILELHARKLELADDADLERVAAMTVGFAGADLANILNEAALLAVRRDKDSVTNDELLEAVERVIAGLEKKNRVLTADEKARVAHHEIGHALVAMMLPGTDPVHKISIIPRGIAALGYTMQLPTEDRFLMTRSELENKIAVLLGGRVAEEVIYDEISTGAEDDLRKATSIARSMVENYGMSERLGEVTHGRATGSPLLGDGNQRDPDMSDETAREIDCEIRRIVDDQHKRARRILESAEPALRRAAASLLEEETLHGDDLRALIEDSVPDSDAGSPSRAPRLEPQKTDALAAQPPIFHDPVDDNSNG